MDDTQADTMGGEGGTGLLATGKMGWGRGYLVRTYSLASCSTVPLAAGDIRDSE